MAAYVREHGGDRLLFFNNLSDSTQTVCVPLPYRGACTDLFTGRSLALDAAFEIRPYSYLWLGCADGAQGAAMRSDQTTRSVSQRSDD